MSNLVQWQKRWQIAGLLAISALLTIAVYKEMQSDSPSTQGESQTIVPSPVKTNVKILPSFEQQVKPLLKLYWAAPKLSVDQLMLAEEDNLEDLSTEINSFQDPPQYRVGVDPTNFGNRSLRDIRGKLLNNQLLIVLHETTSLASAAVNSALTPHPRDEDQISYHAIIRQDGTILYLVDPRKRAYGAGDSVFKGQNGLETVQTSWKLKSSVNNFAYHISLETPSDGYHDQSEHSGYSGAQYSSLAWLIAHAGVKANRITTHAAVDQSGERQDPRSFEMSWFQQDLAVQTTNIALDNSQLP